MPQLDFLPKLTPISKIRLALSPLSSSVASICSNTHAHTLPAMGVKILLLGEVRRESADHSSELSHFLQVVNHAQEIMRSPLAISDLDFSLVQLHKLLPGRKYMYTRDSWIICSYHVREGDQVCLIYGASVPFVLREAEQKGGCRSFILLGECHASSLRDKFAYSDEDYEALRGLSEISAQWESVCLV